MNSYSAIVRFDVIEAGRDVQHLYDKITVIVRFPSDSSQIVHQTYSVNRRFQFNLTFVEIGTHIFSLYLTADGQHTFPLEQVIARCKSTGQPVNYILFVSLDCYCQIARG